MSQFLPFAVFSQGLSVLDPLVPWMLMSLLALAALGLWWHWRLEPGDLPVARSMPGFSLQVPGFIMLATLGLFALLAWGVEAGEGARVGACLGQCDQAALGWARRLSASGLYTFAVALTELGSLRFLLPLVALVAVWLVGRREYFVAAVWVSACLANSLLLRALKNIFERTRPLHDPAISASGYSFPSGHSAGTMMVVGLLVWLLYGRVRPAFRAPMIVGGGLLIVAIAASRVLLQVHFLSDVLAGLLLGAFSLSLTIAILNCDQFRQGLGR